MGLLQRILKPNGRNGRGRFHGRPTPTTEYPLRDGDRLAVYDPATRRLRCRLVVLKAVGAKTFVVGFVDKEQVKDFNLEGCVAEKVDQSLYLAAISSFQPCGDEWLLGLAERAIFVDRRRDPRVRVQYSRKIRFTPYANGDPDDSMLDGQITDLSAGGASIVSEFPVPAASHLYIYLESPGHGPPVRLSGQVVHRSQDQAGRYRYGVAFEEERPWIS